ncbi:MAG: sorbosone dehydrogenase family protein [Flavobacteriales bacterium]|jgi:glucose/arabinose dehydrogenase|nr:sorbosone dehydrogenase family protein [Flavobacteriales bacterium]MBK6893774.1 sorbosone dehydrogenase family protein [Flavobacteriales bacterium]MBK7247728.1 sorbosone dehydrogenase family protein [Flavobacteriales bacterium]MBK9060436.1 sorbosone dehydrogenase family protein [Flavobacteriales bacterium]MBK9597092.1 sorbosone dehydrogenase family protein [Flavobacteriales bacterium]
MKITSTTVRLLPLAALLFMGGVCQPTMFAGQPRLQEISLPPGFHLSIFAKNVRNARGMSLGSDGTVYVGSRGEGNVYALRDLNGDGTADTLFTIATKLNMPVGVAWHEGDLYVSSVSKIVKLPGIADRLGDPPAPVTVYDQYPDKEHHGWKYIAFGPDGKLYVPVGAPCNICLSEDSIFASITRMDPDGSNMEIIAHGVRNSVGFDWDPKDSSLWFTDNGRDMLGNDVPNDELDHLTSVGRHFGYPYCHQGDILDPEFGKGKDCSDYAAPAALLGPHVAALGMKFYRGSMFPEKYRHAIFIAEHGSWNRSTPIGYRVAVAFPKDDGTATTEVFAEGWLDGNSAWGRPVDLLELPDGSMLLSDDSADLIYRITYDGK